jgi:chromosome partitioning protein
LALSLAAQWQAAGHRVLVLDADFQGTARRWRDLALAEGRPSPDIVSDMREWLRPSQIGRLTGGYDRILIDAPSRQRATQEAAMVAADVTLIPCGTRAADRWALEETIGLARSGRRSWPFLTVAVVQNQVTPAPGAWNGEEVNAIAGDAVVLTQSVGYCPALAEALDQGQTVNTVAPDSEGTRDITQLAELTERMALHVEDLVNQTPPATRPELAFSE